MASLEQAQKLVADTVKSGVGNAGRMTLNNLYPDEFEYYLVAFEVVGEDGIEDRFIFPVNPSSMNITDQKNTNIRRTNAGTTILSDNTFTHKMIAITGTFGRRLRLMFGSFEEKARSGRNEKLKFDEKIKTGYGLVKRLERIYIKSSELSGEAGKNNNRPYQLYFYNLSFNQRYLVEMLDFSVNMNEASNMLWNYSFSLRAVSPLEGLIEKNRVAEFTKISAITRSVDQLVNGVQNIVIL